MVHGEYGDCRHSQLAKTDHWPLCMEYFVLITLSKEMDGWMIDSLMAEVVGRDNLHLLAHFDSVQWREAWIQWISIIKKGLSRKPLLGLIGLACCKVL